MVCERFVQRSRTSAGKNATRPNASYPRRQPASHRSELKATDAMHASPPFLPDPSAHQFREMCWGYRSARAVLVVERNHDTTVIDGIWCWLCSRAVHQDCLARDNPATLGCRHPDCPMFPPTQLA